MEDYERYDALGLAALVRTGEVGPEEPLEAATARITAHTPLLNAIVIPMFDEARAAIRAEFPNGIRFITAIEAHYCRLHI